MKIPVLLPNIFDHPFTYSSNLNLNIGDYVLVPFGKSKMIGVVWDELEKVKKKNFVTKKIIKKLNIPPLNLKTLNFLNWFSEYNLISKGMCLKLHMLSNQPLEQLKVSEFESYKKSSKIQRYVLSEEQEKALNSINNIKNKFRVHLLQGTTGSGKTIVYFKAIEKIIHQGQQSLILLPEIGLAGEFEKKFKNFFGFESAVWHSRITPKRKKVIWSGLSNGEIIIKNN